jgi:hypothetical protein
MTRVSEDEVAQARAVPIEALVASVLPLNRQGFAICPFHSEKSPSFHVEPRRNSFFCFGCQAKGDPIEFVKRFRRVDFPTAVKELAGRDYHSRPNYPRSGQKHGASSPVSPIGSGDRPSVPASISNTRLAGAKARAKMVSEIWNGADNSRLIEFYLWTRGIRLKRVPDALRGHNAVLWSEDVGRDKPIVAPPWRAWWSNKTRSWWRGIEKPAVIAAITGDDGEVVAIQRIWVERSIEVSESGLSSKGARAVGLSVPKKTLGPMGSAAVRLMPIRHGALGFAEGIETALSIPLLGDWYSRIPVWAVLGTSRLGFPAHWREIGVKPGTAPQLWFPPNEPPEGVKVQWVVARDPTIAIPDGVRELMFFGDNGMVGQASASHAAVFYQAQGYAAAVYFPEPRFDDFHEQMLASIK